MGVGFGLPRNKGGPPRRASVTSALERWKRTQNAAVDERLRLRKAAGVGVRAPATAVRRGQNACWN